MAFGNWNPWREMEALRREMDRLFDSFGSQPFGLPISRVSFLPGRAAHSYPLLNLSEDADNIYAEALAPGVDPKSLKVSVVRDQLEIEGAKPSMESGDGAEAQTWHRSERAAGGFLRTARLPVEIDADKVTAEYRDGILSVKMPKSAAAKPKKITVNVG
jgi:HSP20 family protein